MKTATHKNGTCNHHCAQTKSRPKITDQNETGHKKEKSNASTSGCLPARIIGRKKSQVSRIDRPRPARDWRAAVRILNKTSPSYAF